MPAEYLFTILLLFSNRNTLKDIYKTQPLKCKSWGKRWMESLTRAKLKKKKKVKGKERNPAINHIKVQLHFNELLKCFG